MNEVCAFWPKVSKEGKHYYSGRDDFGNNFFLFEVVSDNPKAPNFRLCRDNPKTSTKEKPKVSTGAIDRGDEGI